MTVDQSEIRAAARAIVLEARQLCGRDDEGRVLVALDLTVLAVGAPPRRARVSVPVPDEALRHVFPGAELPAAVVGRPDAPVVVLDLEHIAASGGVMSRSQVDPAANAAGGSHGEETR